MQDGYKGVIQALGRSFGDFNQAPWISLSGDDRTGAVTGGETIRVNGRFFDRIKRIAVFALIYDGVPNRSVERRVGKECVRTCRSRWSQYHSKTKTNRLKKYHSS